MWHGARRRVLSNSLSRSTSSFLPQEQTVLTVHCGKLEDWTHRRLTLQHRLKKDSCDCWAVIKNIKKTNPKAQFSVTQLKDTTTNWISGTRQDGNCMFLCMLIVHSMAENITSPLLLTPPTPVTVCSAKPAQTQTIPGWTDSSAQAPTTLTYCKAFRLTPSR